MPKKLSRKLGKGLTEEEEIALGTSLGAAGASGLAYLAYSYPELFGLATDTATSLADGSTYITDTGLTGVFGPYEPPEPGWIESISNYFDPGETIGAGKRKHKHRAIIPETRKIKAKVPSFIKHFYRSHKI